MAIVAKRTRDRQVSVTGWDTERKGDALDAGRQYARWIQGQIAQLFDSERNYKGALRGNTAEYNARKAIRGLDPRKGHAEGNLQGKLRTSRLWTVKRSGKRIIITLHENRLLAAVGYSGFYARAKANSGKILGVQIKWLKQAKVFFQFVVQPTAEEKARQERVQPLITGIERRAQALARGGLTVRRATIRRRA